MMPASVTGWRVLRRDARGDSLAQAKFEAGVIVAEISRGFGSIPIVDSNGVGLTLICPNCGVSCGYRRVVKSRDWFKCYWKDELFRPEVPT